MNTTFSLDALKRYFDHSILNILYYRYKNYIVPVGILSVSLLLFLAVIIPQINQWFGLRNEEKTTREKIAVLKNNLNFLSTVNDTDLDAKLQIVSAALPIEKDFTGILSVLSQAEASSGVVVGDFSFQVGELSSEAKTTTSRPTIDIVLHITGGILETKRFLHEIAKRLPLSEVTNVRVDDISSSTITIAFYYKPLTSILFKEENTLTPLSQKEVSLIEELSLLKK